jgi:TolB-like protein
VLRLKIFGRFRAEDDLGNEIPIKSKKARALLAYLALSPGTPRSREELATLLWSDRGDEQARGSLRQALAGLRRELGNAAGAMIVTDETVSLDSDHMAVKPASPDDELLEGLHINDPAFDEWLRDERLRTEGESPVESRTAGANPDDTSKALCIAILPFVNMSGDTEQDYFVDGLTEDLISAMGRFHSVEVIARGSAFHFKGLSPLAQEVGEKLGVAYLVEGSVRKAGNRIRVSAQLTETANGKQIWSRQYDRELEDVFAVQDDVVAAISGELGVGLVAAAEKRTRSLPPGSLTAYDLLLKGRAAWWRGSVNEGFRLVEEAVSIDPTYAAAQAWLALQYAYQVYSATMDLDPEELGPRSRTLANLALDLDDRDPFVQMAASMCFGFTPNGNKERGLRHIETAAAMNPHDSEILLLRAWHLVFFGRFDEALEGIQRARTLNPLSAHMLNECLADLYYMMGEFQKCLSTYEDQSEAPPQVLTVFAACHAQLGANNLAKRCIDLAVEKGMGLFDPRRFALMEIEICVRPEDADLWREGFRKAGIDV